MEEETKLATRMSARKIIACFLLFSRQKDKFLDFCAGRV